MSDGNIEDLAFPALIGKRRFNVFHLKFNVLADKMKVFVGLEEFVRGPASVTLFFGKPIEKVTSLLEEPITWQ